jgi:hypothetical protein
MLDSIMHYCIRIKCGSFKGQVMEAGIVWSRKSVDQVLNLLHVLDCEVDLVVRTKSA